MDEQLKRAVLESVFSRLLPMPTETDTVLGGANYTPTQDQRAIDVVALDIARAWRLQCPGPLKRDRLGPL